MDPMPDVLAPLEARVTSLETALRRSRVLAAGLATILTLVVLAAFAPQSQENVTTRRLVLTDAMDSVALVLVAGPETSLVLQSPAGEDVFRIGGNPARRITH
jgi:hypothetical protein